MRAQALGWLVAVGAFAACGGDKKAIDASPAFDAKVVFDARIIDAPVDAIPPDARPDAKPSTVQLVDCNSVTTPVAITAANFAFTANPVAATIKAGEGITFSVTGGVHGMTNDSGTDAFSTGTLSMGEAPKCLRFTVAGTFHYHCIVHGAAMPGTITVQP